MPRPESFDEHRSSLKLNCYFKLPFCDAVKRCVTGVCDGGADETKLG